LNLAGDNRSQLALRVPFIIGAHVQPTIEKVTAYFTREDNVVRATDGQASGAAEPNLKH